MSVLTSFLENSSIHGLGFISQTRAFARVFWVIVVICGFTLASQIIMANFQDWAEHPETTTIETLPIEMAPFPRVTVCPPKNTFTNLNYDLLFASNVSWSKAKRHSFVDSLYSKVLDFEFSVALNLYIKEDSNGFRNWYDGLTMNSHPFDFDSLDGKQKVTTYALSGSMSTPLFSERFNMSAFQNPNDGESFEYDMEIDIGLLTVK